ncbi:MAG: hypothetical protein KKF44_02195 [Nanoarchaeota archaeon]|nr:hypothetical protein [Nanoarchaeota archaeon]
MTTHPPTSVNDIRETWYSYYEEKGHKRQESRSLVPPPESRLKDVYTMSAGMENVPEYFNKFMRGESFSSLDVIVQKSFRHFDNNPDDDSIKTLLSLFEMGAAWYVENFEEKQVMNDLLKFLTEKMGLDRDRMYFTVYAGRERKIPIDKKKSMTFALHDYFDARIAWQELGIDDNHIIKTGYKNNSKKHHDAFLGDTNLWAEAGSMHKGFGRILGPQTEIFYEMDDGSLLEIGNVIFTSHSLNEEGELKKAPLRVAEAVSGLERLAMIKQGKSNIYEIDELSPFVEKICDLKDIKFRHINGVHYCKALQQANLLRSCAFLLHDGATPGHSRGRILKGMMREVLNDFKDDIEEKGVYKTLRPLISLAVQPYKEQYNFTQYYISKIAKAFEFENQKYSNTFLDALFGIKGKAEPVIKYFLTTLYVDRNQHNSDLSFYHLPYEIVRDYNPPFLATKIFFDLDTSANILYHTLENLNKSSPNRLKQAAYDAYLTLNNITKSKKTMDSNDEFTRITKVYNKLKKDVTPIMTDYLVDQTEQNIFNINLFVLAMVSDKYSLFDGDNLNKDTNYTRLLQGLKRNYKISLPDT